MSFDVTGCHLNVTAKSCPTPVTKVSNHLSSRPEVSEARLQLLNMQDSQGAVHLPQQVLLVDLEAHKSALVANVAVQERAGSNAAVLQQPEIKKNLLQPS